MHVIISAFDNTAVGGGAGGGGSNVTETFSPGGGSYSGTSISVTMTVAGTGVSKLRWKIDNGAFTTVSALSTSVTVAITVAGHTLFCDALNSAGSVLGSANAVYDKA